MAQPQGVRARTGPTHAVQTLAVQSQVMHALVVLTLAVQPQVVLAQAVHARVVSSQVVLATTSLVALGLVVMLASSCNEALTAGNAPRATGFGALGLLTAAATVVAET